MAIFPAIERIFCRAHHIDFTAVFWVVFSWSFVKCACSFNAFFVELISTSMEFCEVRVSMIMFLIFKSNNFILCVILFVIPIFHKSICNLTTSFFFVTVPEYIYLFFVSRLRTAVTCIPLLPKPGNIT